MASIRSSFRKTPTRDGDIVIVKEAIAAGKNIRAAGIDFHDGDVLLRRGARSHDRALALAAGMNYPHVAGASPAESRDPCDWRRAGRCRAARPRPARSLFATAMRWRALVRSEGADVIAARHRARHAGRPPRAASGGRAISADVLITTGGASVGDHDLVQDALKAEGVDMAFWKIAMRPGKPMMKRRLGPMRVLGLPGNPVSSYVCAFLFLVPLIRALSGRTAIDHVTAQAVLGRELAANDKRQDYLRARLQTGSDGVSVAIPVTAQDSSLVANISLPPTR